MRIFISGSGKLDIEARINDVSQRYNAWQIVAQSTEETKIIAYILYLKGDDVVSFTEPLVYKLASGPRYQMLIATFLTG